MYLVYDDESGKHHRSDHTELFVQAGFILKEKDWQIINSKIRQLKRKWFPKHNRNVELHAQKIAGSTGVFRSLGKKRSLCLLGEAYDFISEVDCTLVASVIHKAQCFDDVDIEQWAHRLLFERVCKYLEKDNRRLIKQGEAPQFGILLIDSISNSFDDGVRGKYREMFSSGTYYITNKYLIEDPFFVKSHHGNMLQMADLVAYCINRCTRILMNQTPVSGNLNYVIEKGYETILHRFDKGPDGQVVGYGIKFFPEPFNQMMKSLHKRKWGG